MGNWVAPTPEMSTRNCAMAGQAAAAAGRAMKERRDHIVIKLLCKANLQRL
jgi:hypothetical protein